MQGVTSISAAIEEAQANDDLLRITREADPHLEVAAIARTTDSGPVVVFEKLRGHEGQRIVTNLFSDRKRIARWCGVEAVDLPRHIADAAINPIPSQVTDKAASQQNVIVSGIDLFKALPLAQQTKGDAGCVITGGLALVRDPDTGAFNGSYHRMRVLGPDLTCITIQAGRHLLEIARKLRARGERRIPISVNIGASPAVLLACSGGTQQTLTPLGYDELGMAGALQGQAVEVAPCKTQEDAWSLAEAEYVLEGYIDTDRLSSEEDSGKDGEKGMMPEAGGYMGRAWRVWEFKVTAITHRNNPVYWFPLAVNAETTNLMALPAEASVFDACRRISPRVFDNCHVLQAMRGCLGVVIRIRRKSFRDEGLQNNLAFGALSAHSDLGWVIAVDHDIDLTNTDDVMWAVITRSDMREGLMLSPRAKVSGMLAEGDAAGTGRKVYIDATAPFTQLDRYERGHFENVAIEEWIGAEGAAKLRARQPDYVASLLSRGY